MSLYTSILLGGIYDICLILIALLFFDASGKKIFSRLKLFGFILFFASLPIGYLFFFSLVTSLAITDVKEWHIWIICVAINSLIAAIASKIKSWQ